MVGHRGHGTSMGGSGECLAPLGGDHSHHHRPGHERRCDADVGEDSGAAGLGQLANLGVLDNDGGLVGSGDQEALVARPGAGLRGERLDGARGPLGLVLQVEGKLNRSAGATGSRSLERELNGAGAGRECPGGGLGLDEAVVAGVGDGLVVLPVVVAQAVDGDLTVGVGLVGFLASGDSASCRGSRRRTRSSRPGWTEACTCRPRTRRLKLGGGVLGGDLGDLHLAELGDDLGVRVVRRGNLTRVGLPAVGGSVGEQDGLVLEQAVVLPPCP